MYGKIELGVMTPVASYAPGVATVKVTSAKPGGDVTVVLEQMRGAAPFMSRQVTAAVADANGDVQVDFGVSLSGPAYAMLMATAYDSFGPHFSPDVEIVVVT